MTPYASTNSIADEREMQASGKRILITSYRLKLTQRLNSKIWRQSARVVAAVAMLTISSQLLATDTVTYYYTNEQGTPLATADAAGTLIASSDYRPYGKQAVGTPTQGPGYTSHVNDVDTSFVYMQARYYDPEIGRFLSTDPVGLELGDVSAFGRFTYGNDNPIVHTDPTGLCADHYGDGTCKVNVDPATGAAGVTAGKQVENVLNRYDKAVNALSDGGNFKIKDKNGKAVGSMSGKEIKAVWNGTSFVVTSQHFNNGGAGGGTGGHWNGDSFSGVAKLNAGAIAGYANAASTRGEAQFIGVSTIAFHELGHETHFGEALTQKYPVTPVISMPREIGASAAAARMAGAVGAKFDCAIPGGCL